MYECASGVVVVVEAVVILVVVLLLVDQRVAVAQEQARCLLPPV